ncbi:MAG TPA: class IV adenylate cyclase [Kineosporiaceae bacterium]|nr:class IV adenylate cyclase [Kineosporiaceae bacterium]
MKYIEVELKFFCPIPREVIDRLASLGGIRGKQTRQVDSYYNAPHRDFLLPDTISEWLRLRVEDGSASINYKNWLPVDSVVKTHCDEYESVVSDVEALRRTLTALDFTPLVVVDKVRQEWHFDEVTVAIDDVASLGSFIEFEFCGDAESVDEALERLSKFTADLGVALGEPMHLGYPHLLLGRER